MMLPTMKRVFFFIWEGCEKKEGRKEEGRES